MDKNKSKYLRRHRRHLRVRNRIEGSPERPRLCVFRSNRHIYGQVIDDWNGRTLASASSGSPELRGQIPHGGNVESAARAGELLAKKCIENGITKVVFDRAGYKFHGRVKAFAEAAKAQFREAGGEGF